MKNKSVSILALVAIAVAIVFMLQRQDREPSATSTPVAEPERAEPLPTLASPPEMVIVAAPAVGVAQSGDADPDPLPGNAASKAEAKAYIETITQPSSEPLQVQEADHFIAIDTPIVLAPGRPAVTVESILHAQGADSTPEAVVQMTPAVAASAVVPSAVTVVSGPAENPGPVTVSLEPAAAVEAASISGNAGHVVRPAGLTELPSEMNALAQVVERAEPFEPGSVFYVRTVRESDIHGVWGIVQEGLVENFARGVMVRIGDESMTYRAAIPADADELLADRSSSYLGRLIYRKTNESYVYNYSNNRMGRNPDRVIPGQEIVIINFSSDELVEIYRRFSVSPELAASGDAS